MAAVCSSLVVNLVLLERNRCTGRATAAAPSVTSTVARVGAFASVRFLPPTVAELTGVGMIWLGIVERALLI